MIVLIAASAIIHDSRFRRRSLRRRNAFTDCLKQASTKAKKREGRGRRLSKPMCATPAALRSTALKDALVAFEVKNGMSARTRPTTPT